MKQANTISARHDLHGAFNRNQFNINAYLRIKFHTMPETQSKKINQWVGVVLGVIAILAAIGNYGAARARDAVMGEKVNRHEILLNEYSIPVIVSNQNNIADDVKEIKADVKDLILSWNEFMINHE